jgi:hypothetical protein
MSDTDEKFSAEEAQRRLEAALRGARTVGHKPQSDMRLGKSKAPQKKSPNKPKRRAAKSAG